MNWVSGISTLMRQDEQHNIMECSESARQLVHVINDLIVYGAMLILMFMRIHFMAMSALVDQDIQQTFNKFGCESKVDNTPSCDPQAMVL